MRLRSNFPVLMIWTALAIGPFGYLLGIVLKAVLFHTAAFLLAGAPSESSGAVAEITAHVLVGIVVLIAIVRAYLAPLPDSPVNDE